MMRAPHSYAVAVRRPDGSLATTQRPLQRPGERRRFWRWPVLRGLATLGQAMTLGVRALRFSGAQAMMEPPAAGTATAGGTEQSGEAVETPAAGGEVSKLAMYCSVGFSLLFFVAFYKLLPLLAAHALARAVPAMGGQILFNLTDGLVRIGLFLAFIGGLALLPDIRRMYEYHGAEHKVVFNYESGQPVDLEHARRFPTLHPRCGTSFMIVIMLIAMAVYMVIPVHSFGWQLLVRLALLPVIAGAGYELIRFGARHSDSVFALLARPGLWLQRITTQAPADEQLECSLRALEEAMALEASQGGELVIS